MVCTTDASELMVLLVEAAVAAANSPASTLYILEELVLRCLDVCV